MTESNNETFGTTSERSTRSSDGSTTQPEMSLEGLLKGRLNGEARTKVEDPSAPSGEAGDSDLPGVQDEDRAAESGIDWSRFDVDAETRAGIEEILRADPNAAKDQDADKGRGEAEEEGGAVGHRGRDERERPPGVSEDQRTIKMLAEDLDVEGSTLYEELMVPLHDGTGRHISLEKLRAGYLGTDADQVSLARQEHDQRIAAFEVDKSEHETRVVRDRHEVSTMLKLLQQHLPPAVVEKARHAAQSQLATAAQDMLERFPAWRDPKVMEGWQARVYECLKPDGFTRADVAAITDVRLCSYLDRMVKLNDWAAKVRNPEPVSKRPSKASRDKSRGSAGPRNRKADLIARAKAPGARSEDKLAGIVALLAGDPPG